MEEESLKWRCWKELKRVCDVVFENNNLKVAIDGELVMLKTLEKGLWGVYSMMLLQVRSEMRMDAGSGKISPIFL